MKKILTVAACSIILISCDNIDRFVEANNRAKAEIAAGTAPAWVGGIWVDNITGCHYFRPSNGHGLSPRMGSDGQVVGCSRGAKR